MKQATRVLGRAFTTDPVFRWLLAGRPDLERRTTGLFGAFVDAAERTEGAEVLVGSHGTAAAIWRPPGRWRTSAADAVRSMPVMVSVLGSRIPRAMRLLHAVERQHPQEPHWYLEAIGVVPEVRGQGHGREVLTPVLDRCDEAGVPAYLESSNPRNLSFYARHGFRTMPALDLPEGCPIVTPMWREPVRR